MRNPLRDAWFVARKEVSYLLRQKETLMWTFLMPPLFFYFIGTVTGGFAADDDAGPDRLAVMAAGDAGFLLDALVGRLEGENFAVVRPATEEELARHDRRLRVPDPPGPGGFTDAALAGTQVTLLFERAGDDPSASFDMVRVQRAVYGLLADLAVVRSESAADTVATESAGDAAAAAAAAPATPAGIGAADLWRVAEAPRQLRLRVESGGRRVVAPLGFEQSIPGTLVMFTMLILLTSGAVLLVIERRQGLLRRLAATPISRGSVVAGKWAGKMALGIVQIAAGMTIGSLLFGFTWGTALGALLVVLFAWAAFNASLGIVLANLARTEAQMAGGGVLATMLLAALGGCWWPVEVTPDWMQSLALLLPTGWAMDAMHRLVSFGDPGTAALPHIAGLTAATLVLGWLGSRTFRYQ